MPPFTATTIKSHEMLVPPFTATAIKSHKWNACLPIYSHHNHINEMLVPPFTATAIKSHKWNACSPIYSHRNSMSEFMGLIQGQYEAKRDGEWSLVPLPICGFCASSGPTLQFVNYLMLIVTMASVWDSNSVSLHFSVYVSCRQEASCLAELPYMLAWPPTDPTRRPLRLQLLMIRNHRPRSRAPWHSCEQFLLALACTC